MKQILFSIVLLFLLAPGWSGAVERGEAAVSGQGFYDSSFKAEAWDFTDVSVWARDGGAISMADRGGEAGAGSGAAARQVVHSGVRDWAVTPKGGAITVVPGELYEIACALRCESCETTGGATAAADHSVGVSVVLYSGNDVKSWTFGGKSARGGTDWQTASSRFIVPSGSTRIQPRIVGVGPGRVSFKNFQLRRVGKIRFPQGDRTATLENESLKLEFAVKDCSLRVLDKRTGRVWISDTRADSLIALADSLERYREETGTVGGAPIHSPGGSQPNRGRSSASGSASITRSSTASVAEKSGASPGFGHGMTMPNE